MSAIRHLIEAHKAAYRAVEAAETGDDADRAMDTETTVLFALVAEPVRSLDAMQAKARYLRDRCPAAGRRLRSDPAMLDNFLASFFQVDPVLRAIENHEVAVRRLEAIEGETREFDQASTFALRAWERLIETVPTTMEGTVAFARYVVRNPDLNHLVGDQGAARAIKSVAAAFARMTGETE